MCVDGLVVESLNPFAYHGQNRYSLPHLFAINLVSIELCTTSSFSLRIEDPSFTRTMYHWKYRA